MVITKTKGSPSAEVVSQHSAPALTLVTPTSDEDVLCTIGNALTRIDCVEVDAVCKSLQKVFFGPYRQHKFIFKFSVIHPEEHAGQSLEMYVRWDPRWKTPPVASKMYKVACIAAGRLSKGQRISKQLFVNRVFRCRLKKVGEGAASYTVVATLVEKLTG